MEPEIYKNFRFGNNQVQYLYQGSTLVWPPETIHPGNPDIRLEYISNGNASTQPNVYFDTQFVWTDLTQVECKYSYHSAINNTALLGCYDGTGGWTKEYSFMLRGETISTGSTTVRQKTTFFFDKTGYNLNPSTYSNLTGAIVGTPDFDVTHTFRTTIAGGTYKEFSVYFDDSEIYHKVPGSSSDDRNAGSIYLFAAHNLNDNTAARFAPADTRIYAFKLYGFAAGNAILYRYFIPVLHYNATKEEYEPCFYDKVSNTYFYNLGTDPVGYAIYYYHGQQDFVLDYIERDHSGYLQYITNCDVSTNVNFNVGFTVGNRNINMTDLTQNVVVGSVYDNSSKFGLFFPYTDNSTNFAFMGLGGNTVMMYNSSGHISDNHHADHIEFMHTPGAVGTLLGAHAMVYWIEFQQGVLPDSSTQVNISGGDWSFTEIDSSVVGTSIGILSGNNVYSQVSTRIFYVDMSKFLEYNEIINNTRFYYKAHKSEGSYIPMIHHGEICMVDIFTDEVLFNVGPGTPKYMELG